MCACENYAPQKTDRGGVGVDLKTIGSFSGPEEKGGAAQVVRGEG